LHVNIPRREQLHVKRLIGKTTELILKKSEIVIKASFFLPDTS
jgi:hypothetical protein